jgi:replicative DNA helicase
MLGNGCMYGYNVPSFITNDLTISNKFCQFIQAKFGFLTKPHAHLKSKVYQWDITKNNVRVPNGNPVTNWLKENDLWANKAKDKHIPNWFMESCDEKSICELIQGLWETDGNIAIGQSEIISYATTSLLLANQILYLLAKIGVIACIDNGYKSKKATTPCYKITILSNDQKRRFISKIALEGYKGVKLSKLNINTTQSNALDKLNRDTTVEISKILHKNKSKQRVQIHGNRRLAKNNFINVLEENQKLLEKYKWIASDSIFWDSVSSINEIGVRPVFDRSVPVSNNFVVNGIIVHNSGAIEQEADMVMFLHRLEYYGILQDESGNSTKGVANLIIAKHRNGALTNINLNFNSNNVSFSNNENVYSPIPKTQKSNYDDLPF